MPTKVMKVQKKLSTIPKSKDKQKKIRIIRTPSTRKNKPSIRLRPLSGY